MATLPLRPQPEPASSPVPAAAALHDRQAVAPVPAHVVATVLLAVLGVAAIWPTALLLWSLWTTDPLKSVGGLVPLVSLVLILRAWRALGWETRGSWWGLGLLAVTCVVVQLRQGAVLELVLGPSWSLTLPPHSLVALAYVSGVVLLVGGRRLWHAARFPVLLTLLVNPVPHVFTRLVDIPLQHASAGVARGLAHLLGQHLTPDQLYLMFTPDFGMFIAPGCNGLRGAVTLGLLALLAGHLYQFRWKARVAVCAAAVLLGYVFNLLRLCLLVVYYVAALHGHWLQGHAEMADYLIGATLFFGAAILLFEAIRRYGPRRSLQVPPLVFGTLRGEPARPEPARRRWMALGGLALVLGIAAVPALRATQWQGTPGASVAFPQTLGPYSLRRTWPETLDTGQTIFFWAEYAEAGHQESVQVGVSPVLGAHDSLLCHTARGEIWAWHGPLALQTLAGPVAFSGTLFNDGERAYMEATTLCSGGRCGQWSSDRRSLGLVYSRPNAGGLLAGTGAPVPVLLRAEAASQLHSTADLQQQLTAALGRFSAYASFGAFQYRYLRP